VTIQNFFTSRDNNANANTYVGQQDRLWYNIDQNAVYVSDGVTPGGIPVDLATGANITANNITVNTVTSTSGNVTVTGNLSITGNISPAASNKIGGISPGPGVVISNEGELTIDTSGLPLSFGNFTANNNILTIINANEDMILETSGAAEIQLIGNVGFYKENGFPPDPDNRYFRATDNGEIFFYVPANDSPNAAVDIIGTASGNTIAPGIAGSMLHVTGQLGVPCRLYYDGNGDYVSWIGRRWNGNVDNPTQVLAGQDVLRINATAATDAGVGNVAMVQISATALENQTTTAQGSQITFTVTPVGSNAASRVNVANVTVANGITATKFTTTGNIDGGNLNLTGNIVADYVFANVVGNETGNVEIESNNTYWYFTTDNRFVGDGDIESGNIAVTGNITVNNIGATGTITSNSATGGVGYRAGAGGVITQETSKSTPVTLNTVTGEITTNNGTISGGTSVTFTLNNSAIANTDVMIINQVSVGNIGDYNFFPVCNTGAANITIVNRSNQNRSDAIVLRYTVIRGARI
jgi:hypothetical protein